MNIEEELEKRGFSQIKFDSSPPRIFGNHSSGVGFFFYSKHDMATLAIYDAVFTWQTPEEVSLYKAWDYMPGEESNWFPFDLSWYKGGDSGALLEPHEILQVFDSLWNTYRNELRKENPRCHGKQKRI